MKWFLDKLYMYQECSWERVRRKTQWSANIFQETENSITDNLHTKTLGIEKGFDAQYRNGAMITQKPYLIAHLQLRMLHISLIKLDQPDEWYQQSLGISIVPLWHAVLCCHHQKSRHHLMTERPRTTHVKGWKHEVPCALKTGCKLVVNWNREGKYMKCD